MNRLQQLQEDLQQTQAEILGMERGEYPPDHLLLPPVQVISVGISLRTGSFTEQRLRPTVSVNSWVRQNVGYNEDTWHGPKHGSPEMIDYLHGLSQRLQDKTVWAYNAKFDAARIEELFRAHALPVPTCTWRCAWQLYKACTPSVLGAYKADDYSDPAFNPVFDTSQSLLTLRPNSQWVQTKLAAAVKRFCLAWDDEQAHSAGYDAYMTRQVVERSLEELQTFNIKVTDPVDVVIDVETSGSAGSVALRGARDRYRETMMAQRGRLLREIYAEENK